MGTAGITNKQIGKIFAMAKEAGIRNDEVRDIVYGLTGCESIKSLSKRQAIRVIDRLNVLAGIEKDIPNRATPEQQFLILRLAKEMGWMGDPSRLRGFLEAKAGVSDVKFLTIDSARRIIEALKAIQKGGRAERLKSKISTAPAALQSGLPDSQRRATLAERRCVDERLEE